MEFYTVDELASILKVDPETVRRFIWNKKLKAFKVGGSWRISKEELKKYLEEVLLQMTDANMKYPE